MIVVLAVPGWFPAWSTWVPVAVAMVSIGASGSWSALIGALAGGVLIAIHRLGGRRAILVGVAIAVLGAGYVGEQRTIPHDGRRGDAAGVRVGGEGGVGRVPTRGNPGRHVELGRRGEHPQPHPGSGGSCGDGFANSPLIGIGVFRQNDAELGFSGPRGMVYLATSGDRVFNDSEPHNVVFFLLQEVGVAGLLLVGAPYAVAWRSCRDDEPPRIGQPAGDTDDDPGRPVVAAMAFDPETAALLVKSMILLAIAISMVSSGLLATGLGLAANAVIFGACGEPPPSRRSRDPEPAREAS